MRKYKLNTLNYKPTGYIRNFHSTNCLSPPHTNDQEEIYKEISELEQEWNENNSDIEKLTRKIQTEEEEFETAEGETEISKCAGEMAESKDSLVEDYDAERNRALLERENLRESKSVFLGLVAASSDLDIQSLKGIKEQLSGHETVYGEIVEMIDKLKDQKTKVTELAERYHENDLAFMPSTPENFPQDSSDVHQTDFNPFEPGEE